MPTPETPNQPYDDEIDLRELVLTLWRQKLLIVAISVIGSALGVGASLNSTRYVSEGLLQTPGVSATNFKRLESVFSNGPRLQQYLHITNAADTPDGALLFSLAASASCLQQVLTPEFAFTDRDQKTFGVRPAENDAAGDLVGIRIRFEHSNPTGGTPVTLLGEYVRDTVIRVNFEGTMLARCAEFQTHEQELRNAQLANDFAITQEENRATTLREIIARNPEAAAIDSRQIVSLEKGSERFLSPAAQLVASEILIADMKLAEVRRARARTASALKRDYYCAAQQALQQVTTGRAFLGDLHNLQATVFQDQDKSIDIIEQTWNELDVERTNWLNTYLERMRFVAPPEGTEIKERKPGLALGLVLGGMLGGMLGVFTALVRGWWRGSRDESLHS